MTNKKDPLFIRAARGEATERPPIWMMRQAGRYLPEYRAIRQQHSFLEMIGQPEIAAEITCQPIRRFGFDAAIMFSDILVTAVALGSDLSFVENKGPVIRHPIRHRNDLDQLTEHDHALASLDYVLDGIRLTSSRLNCPLIGFAGAPFTVAAYMVEGQSSTHLLNLKAMMGSQPEDLRLLMDRLSDLTIDYLLAQAKAGAVALQLFDTWAGLLSWHDFDKWIRPYHTKILAAVREQFDGPLFLFCRNSGHFTPLLQQAKPDVLSLDWTADLARIRQELPPEIAIQGNLDPVALLSGADYVEQAVARILDQMRPFKGFIFNLGHGILPPTDPDQVARVVAQVKASEIVSTLG